VAWQAVEKGRWDLLQREHIAWLARGRTGGGRLELDNADFQAADLHGLRFAGARLDSPRLTGASLAGADLAGTEITAADMVKVVLVYAGCKGARWRRCDLRGANADLATFAGADLQACNLAGAALGRVSFVGAGVAGCTFDQALLVDAALDDARFTGCSFRDAEITRVEGKEFDPRGAARRVLFVDCDLRGANLAQLRIADTRFERCKLDGVRGRPSVEGSVVLVDCDRIGWP
jgi:uncharacterized protein YjbI with pentapeptide repeats